MNLFDRLNETFGQINARRLEKQAREQEQQPGATAGRYNPTLGARDITTADGGTIAGAKSITGAGVGQDTPVQITQSGKGAIYDFKNPKSSGDLVSANSAQERGGKVGGGGLGGVGAGAGGETGPVTGYVPQPDGTCSVVVATSLSQLPPGAFATAQECLASNTEGDWICQGGQCVEAPKGTGRWRSRAECEAALEKQPIIWAPADDSQEGVLVRRIAGGPWVTAFIAGTYRFDQIEFWGEVQPDACRSLVRYVGGGSALLGGHTCGIYEHGLYVAGVELIPRRKCPIS